MTNRLYYEEVYRTDFDATVLEARPLKDGYEVRLDQSAFYPTSGGQPYDMGTLGGRQIRDVYVAEDLEVWHVVDGPLTVGETVHGQIDWERRFDHMQQHAGEHMLASAAWRLLGGSVNGLHLGAEVSTIDVLLPDGAMRVDDDVIRRLEDDVNEKIQRDVPIRQWFPTPEELEKLPLRKAPTVKEHIRIVQIGDVEFVACGGTHPSSAGQIGLLKIVDARPSRGRMRLTFLCGRRAYADYRRRMDVMNRAARALSTSWETLDESVEALRQRLHDAERAVAEARTAQARQRLESLESVPVNGWRVLAGDVGAVDAAALKELASEGIEAPQTVMLLEAAGEHGVYLAFAASEGCPWHMGRLLGEAARAHGGKGGGRPDFAQGSASEAGASLDALKAIRAE